MRKRWLISAFIIFTTCLSTNAQSGQGLIEGFVHCGKTGEAYCLKTPKVILRPVQNWAKTKTDIVLTTDENRQFSQVVSFGEYLIIVTLEGYKTYQAEVYVPSSSRINVAIPLHKNLESEMFDGTWTFEETKNGRYSSLSVTLNRVGNKLQGEYGNVSSKETNGKIINSRILGSSATLELDSDWGGSGTVKITRLSGNKLRWQVIKLNEHNGKFIVLTNIILTRE